MPRGQLVNSSCFCKWRLSLSVLLLLLLLFLFLLLLPLLLPVNEFSEKGPNKTQIERDGGEERERRRSQQDERWKSWKTSRAVTTTQNTETTRVEKTTTEITTNSNNSNNNEFNWHLQIFSKTKIEKMRNRGRLNSQRQCQRQQRPQAATPRTALDHCPMSTLPLRSLVQFPGHKQWKAVARYVCFEGHTEHNLCKNS